MAKTDETGLFWFRLFSIATFRAIYSHHIVPYYNFFRRCWTFFYNSLVHLVVGRMRMDVVAVYAIVGNSVRGVKFGICMLVCGS